ncbi:hypothetical protein [Gaoshiqia sp. Z1-71]|uniref:hypothetical protein n=1 Tax=Gaoshiqia hydrogeniformans TaxID=3290090 RepID=UPI003BF79851
MTLPASNLYKFFSVLGLLIFLFCVFLPAFYLELNRRDLNESQRKLEYLSQEREAMVGKIKSYELNISSADSLEVEEARAAYPRELIDQYRDEIDLRTRQIRLENNILDEQEVREEYIWWGILGFFVLSLALVVYGLIGWHLRIQRPVNILMKRKVEQKLLGQ